MSDQNNDQVVENNDPQDVGNANNGASINDPQGDGDQQNIDQSNVRTDDTDWKSQARKWESRSRANKQKVEELEHELEQNKASYEATIQQMKEAQERSNAIVQVADQYGVDVAILSAMRGDSVEEIEANAQLLQKKIPLYPNVQDSGGVQTPPITRDEIFKNKNQMDRIDLIAQNIDQFK